MRRFAAGLLVSMCAAIAPGHAGDQPDKPTLQSVSKAVEVIAKATKSATLGVNTQTKSLEGSFFGTDMSGIAILQMSKGDTGDSGAAAFLTHQGQLLVSITFNSDVVTTNTVNALFTVLHELVHASLVRKYPFMQHKCDPGAGEACSDACTDPEAGFANALSTGQNADCFDCQFCSEQHADCAAALLACCLAADCFQSSLSEGEKEKLRGVANIGQAKCQDTKAKRPNACSNCAAEIGDPAAVPPTLPEKPADSGCYPDDPETGEDDEGHEALCDKCNELSSELEPQP